MSLGRTDMWWDLAEGAGWVPVFAYRPDRGSPPNLVVMCKHPDGWTLGLEGNAAGVLEGPQTFGRYLAPDDEVMQGWGIGDLGELRMAVVCRVPPDRAPKVDPGRPGIVQGWR